MTRLLPILVLGAVALGGCARGRPRLPEPLHVEEIEIPWADAFPSDIAVDEQGRVWFTDRLTHVIGRYDPELRTFEKYSPPTPHSAPYGMVRSPDGAIWFAESQGGGIGRIDPSSAAITEHALPGFERGGPNLLAYSRGRIWFTARESRTWGWLDVATGEVRVHELPPPEGVVLARSYSAPRPYSIAPVADGIWFGIYDGSALYHVRAGVDTLELHRLARTVPIDSARLRQLRSNPDTELARRQIESMGIDAIAARRASSDGKGRIWVGDFARGRLARFDPASNTIDVFPFIDRASATYGIGVDAWGRVWSYQMYTQQIVMIDPETQDRAVAILRSSGTVRHIAFDNRRKRVWLPISDSGKLGLIQLR